MVTGGGSGIGRELVRGLVTAGVRVAMCDVSMDLMRATKLLCGELGAAAGDAVISCHVADVSDEDQVLRFRAEVCNHHETEQIHLLFNNAGIGAGGSLFTDSRATWDRTFAVCWNGVYYTTRAFLPLMMNAEEGHIVNVSSVNGFWAALGPNSPHSAYSTAKFAVRGFTESLIVDLRVNAPHIKCSLIMPGHVGTDIFANSRMVLAHRDSPEVTDSEVANTRQRMKERGIDISAVSDADIRDRINRHGHKFKESAPLSAAQAAEQILCAVRAGHWRVLIGEDARKLDELVRADPDHIYDEDFQLPFGELPSATPRR